MYFTTGYVPIVEYYEYQALVNEIEEMRERNRNMRKLIKRVVLGVAGLIILISICGKMDLSSFLIKVTFATRKRNVIFMVSDGFGPASVINSASFRFISR